MYCNKCGKEIADGVSFCTHCGGEIIKKDIKQATVGSNTSIGQNSTTLNDSAKSFIGFIGAALMGILALIYLVAAIKGFGGNKDAFEWVEDGYRILGIALHWGICAISAAECLNCLGRVLKSKTKGKYLIGTSISMLMTTALIWIGSLIWNDFNSKDLSIVLYRIFGTYGQIVSKSFLIAIIALICGVLCAKSEQE